MVAGRSGGIRRLAGKAAGLQHRSGAGLWSRRSSGELAGQVLPGSNRFRIAICAKQHTPVRRPALVLHAGARHRTEAGAPLSGIERDRQ